MAEIIALPVEPVLTAVKEEDKVNVRNIIYVVHALKVCTSWSVNSTAHGYEIVGLLDTKKELSVDMNDMELIKKVDTLRIQRIAVCMLPGSNTPTVRISVLAHGEPILLQEYDILRIQKKRKWF